MNRALIVAQAEQSIREGSKSFRMASRLFDQTTRERTWLLYCWCRHCDDVCDGQTLGFAGGEAGSVDTLRALTGAALAGMPTGVLPFEALRLVLEECAIPHDLVLDHLRGFTLDAEGSRPEDEQDLIRYCYHVAGAVGCMMAVSMGVHPEDKETLGSASDLGIAFQLSNIARDIADDHQAGRCYLPVSWMKAHGIDPADPLRPENRDALVALVRRICLLADAYEVSGRRGIEKLPFRSRWAIHAAAGIYGGIGRRVGALGPSAWDQRVTVPRSAKAAIIMRSLGSAF